VRDTRSSAIIATGAPDLEGARVAIEDLAGHVAHQTGRRDGVLDRIALLTQLSEGIAVG